MRLVFNETLGGVAGAKGDATRLGTVLCGEDEEKARSHPARQFRDGSLAVLYYGGWVHHSKVPEKFVSGFRPGFMQ